MVGGVVTVVVGGDVVAVVTVSTKLANVTSPLGSLARTVMVNTPLC